MTGPEAHALFVGLSLPEMVPLCRRRIDLPDDFAESLQNDITELMRKDTRAVPGSLEAFAAFSEAGIPVAVCSNSGKEELHIKMERLGITSALEGRIYSYEDVPRAKPAPDLYLTAAEACLAARGIVLPERGPERASLLARCVVVEDSVAGIEAGVFAGCTVVGLAGNVDRTHMQAAGAHSIIESMFELPLLLGLNR
ncbi:HAD hydrolase, family IA, variant 3 [Hyaloraphidium curvatum]|nr:HAD hydrolase, family IA, variant 3 [Hyaloraphidium curvatum]